MKNRVILSLENPQGDRCVDVFVRPDDSFGFEEFRRDAEDCGAWRSMNRFSGLVFDSQAMALASAHNYVLWLSSGQDG